MMGQPPRPSRDPHDCWIVIDTSVLMGTAKQLNGLGIDLHQLASFRGSAPISLSQPAHLELARHLLQGTLSIRDWRRIAALLDELLDDAHPILPNGPGLHAMLGGTASPDYLEVLRRGLRVQWQVLRDVQRISDLRRSGALDLDGQWVRYRAPRLAETVSAIGQRWVTLFDGLVEERGAPFGDGDRAHLTDEVRAGFRAAGIPVFAELETSVQLAVEYFLLHSKGYEAGTGYKPKRNDGLDYEQLLVLGLPGMLCSSDARFVRKVNALRTPGSDRVVTPAGLLALLRA